MRDVFGGREALGELLDERVAVLVLLDVLQQLLHDRLELRVAQGRVLAEHGEHVGQEVVDWRGALVLLLGELVEEERGERRDSLVLVLEARSHLCDVPLDLHHVIENQVREHHHGRLSDRHVGVPEGPVDVLRPRLERVGEPQGQVTEGNDQVASDGRLDDAFLEQGEHQLEVGLADIDVDHHELGEGQEGRRFERRVGGVERRVVAGADDQLGERLEDPGRDLLLGSVLHIVELGVGGDPAGAQLCVDVLLFVRGCLGGGFGSGFGTSSVARVHLGALLGVFAAVLCFLFLFLAAALARGRLGGLPLGVQPGATDVLRCLLDQHQVPKSDLADHEEYLGRQPRRRRVVLLVPAGKRLAGHGPHDGAADVLGLRVQRVEGTEGGLGHGIPDDVRDLGRDDDPHERGIHVVPHLVVRLVGKVLHADPGQRHARVSRDERVTPRHVEYNVQQSTHTFGGEGVLAGDDADGHREDGHGAAELGQRQQDVCVGKVDVPGVLLCNLPQFVDGNNRDEPLGVEALDHLLEGAELAERRAAGQVDQVLRGLLGREAVPGPSREVKLIECLDHLVLDVLLPGEDEGEHLSDGLWRAGNLKLLARQQQGDRVLDV